MVFKGDHIRLVTGETGEVLEVWGIARTFIKLRTGIGQSAIVMEDQVAEIERSKKKRGR